MRKLYTLIVTLIFSIVSNNAACAQEKKSEYIQASIGLGLVAPNDEKSEVFGSGFYVQAEYVKNFSRFLAVRPYAGLIIASGNDKREGFQQYKIKSNAFMIGAKGRLSIPIPYVAPFLELGIGLSAGSFKTYTPNINKERTGIVPHIPFSLGFALGRNHEFETKFIYYFHDSVEQFSGAAAIGLSFPLKSNQ
jgi:hypothetical protein